MLDKLLSKNEPPFADLQVHSYYSDGHLSPVELLEVATSLGLQALAITDHESMEGSSEALLVAREVGIEVIPALELTTWWETPQGSGEIDILGYFVDMDSRLLNETIQAGMVDIIERIEETCHLLAAAGTPMSMDDIVAINPRYPAKAVSIWALVDVHNLSWEAAKGLFYEHFNRARRCALSTENAIAVIREAGGVPVLAHPGRIGQFGRPLSREQLGWLVESGLAGIEVHYPSHSDFAREQFRSLAEEFDLVQTGGSDEHAYHGKFTVMGSEPVTQEMVENLRARAVSLARTKRASA